MTRLLIVEDTDAIREAVENGVPRLDLETDLATDGWDAIAMLEENDYDAIVVDVNLPGRSGFGVVTFLREEHGHDLGNLILMTDSDETEVARRLGEENIHVLRKDRVHELAGVIEALTPRIP